MSKLTETLNSIIELAQGAKDSLPAHDATSLPAHDATSLWVNRADAKRISGKSNNGDFSTWYQAVGIRVRGTGHKQEYYVPDLLYPPKS